MLPLTIASCIRLFSLWSQVFRVSGDSLFIISISCTTTSVVSSSSSMAVVTTCDVDRSRNIMVAACCCAPIAMPNAEVVSTWPLLFLLLFCIANIALSKRVVNSRTRLLSTLVSLKTAFITCIPGRLKQLEGLTTTKSSRNRCIEIISGSAESSDLFFSCGKEKARMNFSYKVKQWPCNIVTRLPTSVHWLLRIVPDNMIVAVRWSAWTAL